MYAAAAKQGGAGGVPQSVGKEFAASDEPGKLPETKKPNRRSEKMYSGKKVMRNG
jgi:hypothetical protein